MPANPIEIHESKLEGVEYERAREWMTMEVNAAIEGAMEAGAEEFVVADSHGHMRNLMAEKLNDKALLVRGSPRPGCMVEGVDERYSLLEVSSFEKMIQEAVAVFPNFKVAATTLRVVSSW